MKRLIVLGLVALVAYYGFQAKAALSAATHFSSILKMHASQLDPQ